MTDPFYKVIPLADEPKEDLLVLIAHLRSANESLLRENIRLQAELLTLREKAANLASAVELFRAALNDQ